ncbi:TPA: hypothetical protein HA235_07535 [Candidatus Woesearchaeota archaeon]|nr:hypothetical protein [Candidatus Woesearchaeota archaeon]HIH32530.1 hypothetical protein [Candidatus Woesearchaeota archaeon]HIH55094.1 hypothetical protein [Candidatus Woesearchaeota archaeon]HIJ01713.1 hypothetical protein [Candidatus Woesearchaeota archaeon]HIJ13247.1 hypothetical protein [Candidatus Woesearchaeota archaeon]
MPKNDDMDDDNDADDILDDDPIPAKRDTRIFQRKKESDSDKDEDFEEDVFV